MIRESIQLGGRELTIETGRMAKQANGSVLVSYGDTVVLVTACGTTKPREGADFFPLVVDYIEKTYAAGKIPGGYFKREGRLSTFETLVCRLIDRPIRPLFPEGYRNEVQVMATVLSADSENDPAILALIGAGAALHLSDLPFEGPVGGLRVGRIGGEFVVNPTYEQQDECDLELVVAVGKDGILMVEGGAQFLPEQVIVDALEFARDAAQPILALQETLRKKAGKPKQKVEQKAKDKKLEAELKKLVWDKIGKAIQIKDKLERYRSLDGVFDEALAKLVSKHGDELASRGKELKGYYSEFKSDYMRHLVLDEGRRIDGRKNTDVRRIDVETGVLPRTHGSALFTRGETQALVTVTLGTAHDEQRIDALTGDWRKSFLLHYNFPPFSVGEVRMLRGPSRRDIGHGALAERGVEKILPAQEHFPYTIRVVSEVLESNGSSSMATVCGASVALMDAGVPVGGPVAGIAMGLIKEGDKVAILTDILGDEDHLGDMDFKVVGNADGISSVQMDIKVKGLSREIMETALDQAKDARLHIIGKMNEAISEPRAQISPHAPRIFTVLINPDRIRDLIGPGGKHIRGIVDQTGVTIDVDDDGTVKVAAVDERAAQEAIELIRSYTEEVEVGKIYLGTVVKVLDFGAFVQIMPGTDGLVPIAELSHKRVRAVEDVLKEGDEVLVKVISVDRGGKIKLSRKAALAQGDDDDE
jgi:polyribonucleotide nucleotidyltransferase